MVLSKLKTQNWKHNKCLLFAFIKTYSCSLHRPLGRFSLYVAMSVERCCAIKHKCFKHFITPIYKGLGPKCHLQKYSLNKIDERTWVSEFVILAQKWGGLVNAYGANLSKMDSVAGQNLLVKIDYYFMNSWIHESINWWSSTMVFEWLACLNC